MTLSKKPYRGTRDFFPEQKKKLDFLFERMKKTAQLFGFEPYDGPLLEPVDLYKAKSGEELINEQIYSFLDRGNREVAIRPEMTPTLARMVAQIHKEVSKPLRWYSIPNLMRYEKPQRGRLREHWQLNLDIFGAPEHIGEIEILSYLQIFLASFNANQSHYSILINDRKIVDGIFQKILSLSEDQSYKMYKIIDKAKKISAEALEQQLSELLNEDKKEIIKKYLSLSSFSELKSFAQEQKLQEEFQYFNDFLSLSENLSYYPFLQYDPCIVRGLDYYTGVVFEIFDLHPDNKRAICGGGSYSNLMSIFNESPLAGVGVGLGDVTLVDFLETHQLMPKDPLESTQVFISFQIEDALLPCLQIAQKLRASGIYCELHPLKTKMKKVFTLAEKKNIPMIVFLGEDEIQNKTLQIKNTLNKQTQSFPWEDFESIISFIKG